LHNKIEPAKQPAKEQFSQPKHSKTILIYQVPDR